MIRIDPNKNKFKSIAIVVFALVLIFGVGYLIGYFGTDLIKKM